MRALLEPHPPICISHTTPPNQSETITQFTVYCTRHPGLLLYAMFVVTLERAAALLLVIIVVQVHLGKTMSDRCHKFRGYLIYNKHGINCCSLLIQTGYECEGLSAWAGRVWNHNFCMPGILPVHVESLWLDLDQSLRPNYK